MIFTKTFLISMVLVFAFAKFINGEGSDETSEEVTTIVAKPVVKKFTTVERSTSENVQKDLEKIKENTETSSGVGNTIKKSFKAICSPLRFLWNSIGKYGDV
uniref:Uncharacterized protein n=1 Tax=Sipha flava TaxID=143950 RepID=A0A2S2R4I7_9HEMI